MADSITVERSIAASPEQLWPMITDLTRMGEWSPEATGGEWIKGATGPALGATFKGRNAHNGKKWSSFAVIDEFNPPSGFGFMISAIGLKVARWHYSLEATADGSVVRETWTDHRSGWMKFIGKLASGVADRDAHNRANMEATLAQLAAAVEAK